MQTFLNNLYKFILGIAVILAILMIIWGGIEYALSEAITNKAAGKKKITNALYGLVLVLAPTVVFSIINPSILNLSVNFPPLNTQEGSGVVTQTPCTNTNCLQTSNVMPSTVQTGTSITACSDNTSCDAAKSACAAHAPTNFAPNAQIVCAKPDGSVDPNGRTDYNIPYVSTYACASGESLVVTCQYILPTGVGTPD